MSISALSASKNPASTPPKSLRGFEAIKRYWDPKHQTFAARILPGEYYVTVNGEMVTTVLGSCVSACIRDKVFGIGGMNHFMLPAQGNGGWEETVANSADRYGNFAMEHLINDILKNGGHRKNLEIKLFGGGKVLAAMTDVGHRNIKFVKEYLATENLRVISEDLGNIYPRKVVFFPTTGRALVKKLESTRNDTIAKREQKYMGELQTEPVCGEIDLF